ncbi:MAG: thiamine-phosphate kinase [Pseudomonadales bacterium]|jgi:thiamine-monophosphate kinase|nr:thiamine-phosphate kinase [Pseudomonadales bacterium]MDP6469590.1 thiamine-phosphate kinase [Pseudomonadales bacterium]MDP6827431.1 thiamine-phosphate kinase [Pseudomonadales bacterium]MDP6971254.1 thiamine-phosphate kinase [Pseudomonadales bacterium]
MNEFELIDRIVTTLGDSTAAPWVTLGPGDDAAIVATPKGCDTVSSIDTLVEGVHFPHDVPAELIAYRAMMVSLSDIAAMAARPGYVLVAANLPEHVDGSWVEAFARGVRAASERYTAPVVGGNLARGRLSISVSSHGFVDHGGALTRAGARPGDFVCVTGPVGAAAAALVGGAVNSATSLDELDDACRAYYAPELRFDLAEELGAHASAAIDVSDGLLQDLSHICSASGVGASLVAERIPGASGATLDQALGGGDDYVLCFTTSSKEFAQQHIVIGEVTEKPALVLDGELVARRGFSHF